jgi:glycosyltransferase involved in cell wall biosynthesis
MEQYGLGGVEVQLVNMINNWPGTEDEIYFITNPENQGIELFTSLLKKRCRIEIVKLRSYCFYAQKVHELKAPKYIKKMIWYMIKLLQYPLFMLDIFRLAAVLRRYRFDTFVSDNGGYPASDSCRAAVLASYLCGIKRRFLIVHHAATPPEKIILCFEWLIDKLLQRVINKIITVSDASKIALLSNRFFNKKIEMIHNGIDEEVITGEEKDLRKTYNIKMQMKIIGIMGNMDSYKGHKVMIEAAPMILAKYPDAHFIFVGSLYDQSWHREHADSVIAMINRMNLNEHITVTGYLKGKPQGIINQFDILAMTTLDFEGFGIVLAEAMILKKPIVASQVGAIPEVVVDGQSGLLVEPGDPVVLAGAICRLLGDPALMDRLGKNARQRYEDKFTAKIMAKKYYELITRDESSIKEKSRR